MEFAALSYSEEQVELNDVASDYCRDKSPINIVRELLESDCGYDEAIYAEMADMGWMGVAIPAIYGGIGLGFSELMPLVEQMGRNLMAGPFIISNIAAQAILAGNNDSQKQMLLNRIIAGDVATLALVEEESDWDLEKISCCAKQNGEMVDLHGSKNFVLWAQKADIMLISVMLDDKPAIIWLDKADIAKAEIRRETIIDETKRSASINFNGVQVHKSQILQVDDARSIISRIILLANLFYSAEMVGGTHRVIDYTLDYLRTRRQFGKIIGEYQALKHPMVNIYAAYENARSLLLSAAGALHDQLHGPRQISGQQHIDGQEHKQGEIAVLMAKAAALNCYSTASDRAIQFHGGFGFTHDCDAGLHRRAAIFHASQFGDAIWQRRKLGELLFG